MKGLLLIILLFISTCTFSEVSLYKGVATTHLFMSNEYLNNDNGVMILKVNDLFTGTMTNSYGETGYLLGYQPEVYSDGKLKAYFGVTAVTGYRRGQMLFLRSNDTNYREPILIGAPVLSVSYSITKNISIQVNSMAGIILNAGIRIDI